MTTDDRTVTIETESAGSYASATAADLERLVHLISASNCYLIVHRSDTSEFAQAALARRPDASFAGGFIVEQGREGRIDQTTVKTPGEVYELLAAWAFEHPPLARPTWAPLRSTAVDVRGNTEFNKDGSTCVAVFQPFDLRGTGADESEAFRAVLVALEQWTRASRENASRFSAWAADHLITT